MRPNQGVDHVPILMWDTVSMGKPYQWGNRLKEETVLLGKLIGEIVSLGKSSQ